MVSWVLIAILWKLRSPICTAPYSLSKNKRRSLCNNVPRYIRYVSEHHLLFQQLRIASVPEEVYPADDQQCKTSQAAANLRWQYADTRLTVCRRPLQSDRYGGQRREDGEIYNVGGHNEKPNVFIAKTIIPQLHDRLKDDWISENLIKHIEDRWEHDMHYGIDPTKIKNDLDWYPEFPFEVDIVKTID